MTGDTDNLSGVIEFVAPSGRGRSFSVSRPVHLGDAGVDGRLRVDGAVRFLQDVASDDWADVVESSEDTWVARRTALRLVEGATWPVLGDLVSLTTWCGGVGAAWAERRTTIAVNGDARLEAVALWVPLGPSGRPRRLGPDFFAVYLEATAGRRVSGKVPAALFDPESPGQPWPVRRSDLDVVGHVNNAAVWHAVTEVAGSSPRFASVTHHGALEVTDEVRLHHRGGRMWLVVGDDARVSGHFERG